MSVPSSESDSSEDSGRDRSPMHMRSAHEYADHERNSHEPLEDDPDDVNRYTPPLPHWSRLMPRRDAPYRVRRSREDDEDDPDDENRDTPPLLHRNRFIFGWEAPYRVRRSRGRRTRTYRRRMPRAVGSWRFSPPDTSVAPVQAGSNAAVGRGSSPNSESAPTLPVQLPRPQGRLGRWRFSDPQFALPLPAELEIPMPPGSPPPLNPPSPQLNTPSPPVNPASPPVYPPSPPVNPPSPPVNPLVAIPLPAADGEEPLAHSNSVDVPPLVTKPPSPAPPSTE